MTETELASTALLPSNMQFLTVGDEPESQAIPPPTDLPSGPSYGP